jgi:hypothetical protein
MSKLMDKVFNASGKPELRPRPATPETRNAEPDSTYERPWFETAPVAEADKWWERRPGQALGDGVPLYVPEVIDRSPKARAHAQMVLARNAYEATVADYEALGGHRDDEA